MGRPIEQKAVANKSPTASLFKEAPKAILNKGPRPAIYWPTTQAELQVREYQKPTGLLEKKTPFLRFVKAIIGYSCE